MKILTVSHSSVITDYRERMQHVARFPEVDLTLLVPQRWVQANKWMSTKSTGTESYTLVVQQPITWGLRSHRLRNGCHIYRGLKRILAKCQPDILELWEEPFFAVTAQAIYTARKLNPKIKIIYFSAQNILKKYQQVYNEMYNIMRERDEIRDKWFRFFVLALKEKRMFSKHYDSIKTVNFNKVASNEVIAY